MSETQFYLTNTFPTQEFAIETAIQAGQQKIDAGFEHRRILVNGQRRTVRNNDSRVQKSASQIAVQNAVQTVLRDTLEPP